MYTIAQLAHCPEDAVVKVQVPENVEPIKKRRDMAHFIIRSENDGLPVHIFSSHHGSYKGLRGRELVCEASLAVVNGKHGTTRSVLRLIPVLEPVLPNAYVRHVGAGEFRVVPLS